MKFFLYKSDSGNFLYPPVKLDNNSIAKCTIRTVLDSKLNFNSHVDQKITKVTF